MRVEHAAEDRGQQQREQKIPDDPDEQHRRGQRQRQQRAALDPLACDRSLRTWVRVLHPDRAASEGRRPTRSAAADGALRDGAGRSSSMRPFRSRPRPSGASSTGFVALVLTPSRLRARRRLAWRALASGRLCAPPSCRRFPALGAFSRGQASRGSWRPPRSGGLAAAESWRGRQLYRGGLSSRRRRSTCARRCCPAGPARRLGAWAR